MKRNLNQNKSFVLKHTKSNNKYRIINNALITDIANKEEQIKVLINKLRDKERYIGFLKERLRTFNIDFGKTIFKEYKENLETNYNSNKLSVEETELRNIGMVDKTSITKININKRNGESSRLSPHQKKKKNKNKQNKEFGRSLKIQDNQDNCISNNEEVNKEKLEINEIYVKDSKRPQPESIQIAQSSSKLSVKEKLHNSWVKTKEENEKIYQEYLNYLSQNYENTEQQKEDMQRKEENLALLKESKEDLKGNPKEELEEISTSKKNKDETLTETIDNLFQRPIIKEIGKNIKTFVEEKLSKKEEENKEEDNKNKEKNVNDEAVSNTKEEDKEEEDEQKKSLMSYIFETGVKHISESISRMKELIEDDDVQLWEYGKAVINRCKKYLKNKVFLGSRIESRYLDDLREIVNTIKSHQ